MKQLLIIAALLLPTILFGQVRSAYHESDTTIIASNSNYGKKVTTRFYFRKENYQRAFEYITLQNIPYRGLNDMAAQRMNELSKYIIRQEEVKPKRKTKK